MKRKKFIFLFFSLCMGVISNGVNAQDAAHTVTTGFVVGELIASAPDSIYKAHLDITIGDSVPTSSIHLTVGDTVHTEVDQIIALAALPIVPTPGAWREGKTVHMDVPDYDPFLNKKRYFVELLDANSQLILQIEKEY